MFTKRESNMLAISFETEDELWRTLQVVYQAAELAQAGRFQIPGMLLLKDPSVPPARWEAFADEARKEFELERSRTKHDGIQN